MTREDFNTITGIEIANDTDFEIVNDVFKHEFAHTLIVKSVELEDSNLAQMAIDIIGRDAFIKYKIENKLHLFRKDRDYLLELVGEEKLIEILNNQVA